MLHKLILKVTKFKLPPSKRLSTVVKISWGGGGGASTCGNAISGQTALR